jgi:hypothetical protein
MTAMEATDVLVAGAGPAGLALAVELTRRGIGVRLVYPMPVTGMNSGIHDAFNLGWKLAAAVRGESGTWLLDTYATERRAVAERLLHRAERILGFGSATAVDVLHDRLKRGVFDVRDEPEIRYPPGDLSVDRLAGEAPGVPAGAVVPVLGAIPALVDADHPGWTVVAPPGGRSPRMDAAVAPLGPRRTLDGHERVLMLVRPDGPRRLARPAGRHRGTGRPGASGDGSLKKAARPGRASPRPGPGRYGRPPSALPASTG